MTACEACWDEASTMASLLGGSAADHYRDALARNEGKPGHRNKASISGTSVADETTRDVTASGGHSEDQA